MQFDCQDLDLPRKVHTVIGMARERWITSRAATGKELVNMAETTSSAARAESAIPTDEELLERARRIGPGLVKRQAETEALGRYAEDTHQAFSEAGFYRMLIPRRFGGYAGNLETYFKVVREIA